MCVLRVLKTGKYKKVKPLLCYSKYKKTLSLHFLLVILGYIYIYIIYIYNIVVFFKCYYIINIIGHNRFKKSQRERVFYKRYIART